MQEMGQKGREYADLPVEQFIQFFIFRSTQGQFNTAFCYQFIITAAGVPKTFYFIYVDEVGAMHAEKIGRQNLFKPVHGFQKEFHPAIL